MHEGHIVTKKKLLISIIIILAVAAVTIGIVYFVRVSNTPPPEQPVSTETTPDLSVNYGACDLVSVSEIKASLGETADTISEGFNTGRGYESNGNSAQNCVYGLSEKVTSITSEMLDNSLYTTVYVYGSQESKDADQAVYTSNTVVTGIGDKAVFINSSDADLKTTKYELRVASGMRYFAFTLKQATDSTLLDEPSAIAALKELASNIDYASFQDTK
jgi:hypothetical protein